jgi:hypothetical protein
MQHDRLEEQRKSLTAKLARFEGVALVASGMHADSAMNWFNIRHVNAGQLFTIDSSEAADFSTRSFTSRLERFAEDCRPPVDMRTSRIRVLRA